MLKYLYSIAFFFICLDARSQKIDSIYFHLYTDSLKKGTYNYINIDGKLDNGRWMPLTAKEINFTASAGVFNNNSLFIDTGFTGEKITIKAVFRADTVLSKETTIYIKKLPDNEQLKTNEDMLPPRRKRSRK